jgi:Fe-S-cluster-containing dehydrogenase component
MSSPNQISAPAFVHNLDTCVGCHACVIACANENKLAPGRSWRQIVSYNLRHVPDLPVYHLTLACNHCLDAPCIKGCPAAAIERSEETGAVLIDDAKCIGCRYCGWVCPFDAPEFNSRRGVMEKCTFCNDRLKQNSQPACTSMCPTGALTFGRFGERPGVSVEGFPDTKIRPAITFLPMAGRAPQPAPSGVPIPDESEVAAWATQDQGDFPVSKISLKGEWPLAVFTFVGIALVAWFLAASAGGQAVIPGIFAAIGLTGMGLSMMHLGKKGRALRAIVNWRSSWLSREVIVYPLFISMVLVSAAVVPGSRPTMWITAIIGALLLVTMDGVYAAMAREWSAQLDGQASVLSAAFLVSVFAGNALMAVVTGLLRLYALMDRVQNRRAKGKGTARSNSLAILRAVFGFVVPAVLWMLGGEATAVSQSCVLLGEFADRLDFYDSLDITTPRRAMAVVLEKNIFSVSSSAGG